MRGATPSQVYALLGVTWGTEQALTPKEDLMRFHRRVAAFFITLALGGIPVVGCEQPAPTACEQICRSATECDSHEQLALPADQAACVATCDSALDAAAVDCVERAVGGGACDTQAAATCAAEPAEPAPSVPEDVASAYQAGFLSLADLGCDAQGCDGTIVINDPGGVLPALAARVAAAFPEGDAFVAMLPGFTEGAPSVFLDAEVAAELLADQPITPDREGAYTVVSGAASDESCGTMEIALEATPNGLSGGICATLSIAHSLAFRLGVVPIGWDGVLSGDNWEADYLKAIYEASGDADAQRGLTREQISRAHTADWNSGYTITQSLDWTERPAGGKCDVLEDWCNDIIEKQDERDDCILVVRGGSLSRPRGHAMPIQTASWDANACHCVFQTANTGTQDSAAHDFARVSRAPGNQTWEVPAHGPIPVTAGPSQGFFNNRYDRADVACFDADRTGMPWETPPPPVPGSAFPP
jgi:hypothetical protein